MSDFVDPANGNANATNATNGSPEVSEANSSVPLTDLAERLGVSIPRLQRLLKRSEFVRHVRKGQRKTATGTRTVTLVSVSVLEAVEQALREGKGEQKRFPNTSKAFDVLVSDDERARALVGKVLEQAEARIAELSAALFDVRGERDRLLEERERERLRIEALESEIQDLWSIAAKKETAADQAPDIPVSPASDTESGAAGQSGVDIPAGAPAGYSEAIPPKRRGFWDRLLNR